MSIYSPLDPSKNEIRMLKLHRGVLGQPLSGDLLSPISLHLHYNYEYKEFGSYLVIYSNFAEPEERGECTGHHPSYEALSYQWGPETPKHPIQINNQPQEISGNLYSALQRLRLIDTERVLWIDAICIDQGNPIEKGNQVQLMAAIYQRAQRTLVWLGEASHDSHVAMDTLTKLGGKNKEFSVKSAPGMISAGPHFSRFRYNWPFEDRSEPSRDRIPDPIESGEPEWLQQMFDNNQVVADSLGLVGPDSLGDDEWTALEAFFTREWWERVWIIQEVAYAREVLLHCGDRSIYWDTLHNLWRQRSCWHNYRLHSLMASSAKPLDKARSSIRHPWRALGMEELQNSLMICLAETRSWQSTHPVDKIFALLGLASFSRNLPIQPDYVKAPEDVFCDVTMAIIEDDQNLDILSQVHHCEGDTPRPNWPSWAPDWTQKPKVNSLIDIPSGLRPYDAGGRWTASYAPIAPDTGGRLRGGWVQRFESRRDGSLQTSDGLVRRLTSSTDPNQAFRSPGHAVASRSLDSPRKLTVGGVLWDKIDWISEPVTVATLTSDALKETIQIWLSKWATLPTSRTEQNDLSRLELLQFPPADPTYFLLTLLRGITRNTEHTEHHRLAVIRYHTRKFLAWLGYEDEEGVGSPPCEEYHLDFDALIRPNLVGWKFCTTKGGHYGFVPGGARKEDAVCIIFGSSVPFVLRKAPAAEEWQHVGTAYFYHMMAGECLELIKMGLVSSRRFVLY
jgi:hypothetical protein